MYPLPAARWLHEDAPLSLYNPRGQALQVSEESCPDSDEYLPMSHDWQVLEALYCPGAQVHLLWLAAAVLHIKPVRTVHIAVSHRHSALLASIPSVCLHVGGGVHWPVAAVHRNPCEVVGSPFSLKEVAMQGTLASPQKQGSVFDVTPLICVQSDAATHRQKAESSELQFAPKFAASVL